MLKMFIQYDMNISMVDIFKVTSPSCTCYVDTNMSYLYIRSPAVHKTMAWHLNHGEVWASLKDFYEHEMH